MSKHLLRNARLMDPNGTDFDCERDVRYSEGKILEIGQRLTLADDETEVDCKGLWLFPGLVDLRSFCPEPGFEHRDTIQSFLATAQAGGYAHVAVLPNNQPLTHNRAGIQYRKTNSQDAFTQIHALGAATEQLEGKEPAELFDMHQAGAVGFSNGNIPYENSGILQRLLLYCQPFNGRIYTHAVDQTMAPNGSINESVTTLHTGLKSIPAYSEFTEIQKQLEVLRYTGGQLHFSHLSSARSVDLIAHAKADGLKVTCDVSIMHLCYTDAEVLNFDTRFKINPPLREETDRKALVEGVKNGTIDAIISDHFPLEEELKKLEFDYAEYGAATLQTPIQFYIKYLQKELDWSSFFNALHLNPGKILSLNLGGINTDQTSKLVLFDPETNLTLNRKNNPSMSENHPLWGQTIKGTVVAHYF